MILFIVVILVMTSVFALVYGVASLAPARRAASVNPAIALRAE